MGDALTSDDIELEVTELPLRFSLFDWFSWSWLWRYKRYEIVFLIRCPPGCQYQLESCQAMPKSHIEGETKEVWWLLSNFTLVNTDRRISNEITLTVPFSKTCERISFITIPNPKAIAVAIKTQN